VPAQPPTDHDEPWGAARAAARSEVAAALAPRERRCPSCGAVSAQTGRFCPSCGADYASRPRRRPRRRVVVAVALALLAVVVLSAAVVPGLRRDAEERRAQEAERQQALEAAERVRLERDARPHRAQGPPLRAGEDPLAHRAALLRRAEQLITRDARARIRAGTLDGPVAGTACEPFPHTIARLQLEASAGARAGRYDCVAYKRRFELPPSGGRRRTGLFGFPYWVVIDYRRSTLVWCKVTPRAGEGGRSLAAAPVPVPCREPTRRPALRGCSGTGG
jgi:predicted nucleic acid-binding Zn ribbon protein